MANAATNKQGSSAAKAPKGASASTSTGARSRERARERDSDARELTGERDENYNLIAVLYHGLQGADQCAMYADDAEEAGDDEVAEFLRASGRAQADLARRAKALLIARLSNGGAASRSEDDDDDDEDDDDEV
jgi:hypothetical protein